MPVDTTPPPSLVLAGPSGFEAGTVGFLLFDGAPPGARIAVARGEGLGSPLCPLPLGGACIELDAPVLLGRVTADATGRAVLPVSFPAGTAGVWWMQAAVLAPSPPGVSVPTPVGVFPADFDGDADGAPDLTEWRLGLDITDPDSDGDGVDDGLELDLGMDPLGTDSDGDGEPDGRDPHPLDPDPLAIDDVVISDPNASITDPEFDPFGHMIWQTEDTHEGWIATIRPFDGALVPTDGRGVSLGTGLFPKTEQNNGPEWVVDAQGSRGVFSIIEQPGDIIRLRQAVETPQGWEVLPLAGDPLGNAVLGSDDLGDTLPRVLYATEPRQGRTRRPIVWRAVDDPTVGGETDLRRRFGQWVRGADAVAGSIIDGQGRVHATAWDCLSNTGRPITSGEDEASFAYGWTEPSLGGDVVYAVVREDADGGPDRLQLFHDTGTDFVLWRTIDPPLGLPTISSPEPLVYGGRTWLVFVAENADGSWIYLTSVDPADSTYRRISGAVPMRRVDSEPVVVLGRPWVFYTERTNGQGVIHRVDPGL